MQDDSAIIEGNAIFKGTLIGGPTEEKTVKSVKTVKIRSYRL